MTSPLSELIKFYNECGASAVTGNAPLKWAYTNISKQPPKQNIKPPIQAYPTQKPKLSERMKTPEKKHTEQAHQAWTSETLEELRSKVEAFEGCSLKQTARNTVFSDGDPKSGFMLIGEAPGADEDAQGRPFVGQSGQLLNAILHAIGIDRAKGECYITNIVPWRPPANRPPSLDEITLCRPFLEQHLALVQPKIIVLLGGIACKAILGETSIGPMRKKPHQYTLLNGHTVPVYATYHPAFLLRSPRQKGYVWHDWLMIKDAFQKVA